MKSVKMFAYLLICLQSIGFITNSIRYLRRIISKSAIILFILFAVHRLSGCHSLPSESVQSFNTPPNSTEQHSTEQFVKCEPNHTPSDNNHATDDWLEALMLTPSERKKALSTVEIPRKTRHTWLRVFLLTHEEASYRELQEAEKLMKNELNSKNTEPSEYASQELYDYILKLNLYFQKNKSEIVLLQRQLNARDRSIKTQKLVNEVLENKIEALTNIEQRMKLRPNKIEP